MSTANVTAAKKFAPDGTKKARLRIVPNPNDIPTDPLLASFASGVATEIPYEPEVAMFSWRESVMDRAEIARGIDMLLARNAELEARNAELEAEVMDYAGEFGELLDELKRANLPVDLHCRASHILMLLEIDKGATVKAIADSLQAVAHDMKARFMPKYKGKVKIKFICTQGKDGDDMLVAGEAAPEVPVLATGGKLTLATDGTIVTRRESAQAFQLKMVEAPKDPLREMYGEAEGGALRAMLRAKGIREITVDGDNGRIKVRINDSGEPAGKAA